MGTLRHLWLPVASWLELPKWVGRGLEGGQFQPLETLLV